MLGSWPFALSLSFYEPKQHKKGSKGASFAADFAAMIHLLKEIREKNKDVWINLSTGTWPSPFWLQHADCIWRRGHDHYFAGEGPPRERWMTYRDGQ